MPNEASSTSLTWVHIGDLHLKSARDQNFADLLSIVAEINTHLQGWMDFCVLPGDNADNGTGAQYQLLRRALSGLDSPVHIIPGDHDREPGDLTAFYSLLGAERLPKALSLNGYRCLFLDIVSAGRGGPDFRLGAPQLEWLQCELDVAKATHQRSVIFMHAYPADLKSEADQMVRSLKEGRVLVVDMGHTHYNELANDGHTIFSTTRSTGQIEEGPVGFSVMSLEGNTVSWRFKPLASTWPFVMITAPADERLATKLSSRKAADPGLLQISARAWSAAGILQCRCRIDQGAWTPMTRTSDASRWVLPCPAPRARIQLTVEVEDRRGGRDTESIWVPPAGIPQRARTGDGSDADSVGAWLEKHLLGTQLGPNRNCKHW